MIAALALIGFAGYRYSPLLLPKSDVTLTPPADCDLNRSACSVAAADGASISFAIAPQPIPLVEPLQLAVTVRGLEAVKVEVDFAGIGMNMGFLRPLLSARGEGRHTGETALPVCVTGEMAWQATVLLETPRQRIAVPFRFDVRRH